MHIGIILVISWLFEDPGLGLDHGFDLGFGLGFDLGFDFQLDLEFSFALRRTREYFFHNLIRLNSIKQNYMFVVGTGGGRPQDPSLVRLLSGAHGLQVSKVCLPGSEKQFHSNFSGIEWI